MKLRDIIKVVAPTLATAVAGPVGGLAVKLLGDALGIDEPTQQKIEDAFTGGQMSGDQIVAVKLAEQQFTLKCRELDIRLEEINVDDRKSARQREEKVGGKTTALLAWIVVGAFVGMAFGVLFGTLKAETVLAGTVIGYLSAKAEQVLAYYFGSSRGSDDKNSVIATLQAALKSKG